MLIFLHKKANKILFFFPNFSFNIYNSSFIKLLLKTAPCMALILDDKYSKKHIRQKKSRGSFALELKVIGLGPAPPLNFNIVHLTIFKYQC